MESKVYNEDCMVGMARYPDKYFDLAIVDPPYGIGHGLLSGEKRGSKFIRTERHVDWDIVPPKSYWDELFRVSKNQIVWGGNYFLEYLGNTRCVLSWDKMQEFSGADFELAWTSFNLPAKTFRYSRVQAHSKGTIHPTEKPIKLYRWILKNYAKEGDKILDTHLGSGSSRIAAYEMGFDFVGFELDFDYYTAAEKRYQNHIKQLTMF